MKSPVIPIAKFCRISSGRFRFKSVSLTLHEPADFTAHLTLETERAYLDVLLAINSSWGLEIVSRLDQYKEW